jgi:ELWxxDGT repeat protein
MAEQVVLVKDINPGNNGSSIRYFTEVDGKLFFTAADDVNGIELWVTDGTTEGTQLVKDINPGLFNSNPRNLTEIDGKLYFSAGDDTLTYRFYVSDGTTTGTQLVTELRRVGNNITGFDGKILFTGEGGLYVTNNTPAGIQLLKNFNYVIPGISFPELNGKLYFAASGNDSGSVNDIELWATDGTTGGTQLLKDINPGVNSSAISYLTKFNDKLFFQATDGVSGRELWMSDGTAEGTQLVKDINPSDFIGSYAPNNLTEFNGKLYFTANNRVNRHLQ